MYIGPGVEKEMSTKEGERGGRKPTTTKQAQAGRRRKSSLGGEERRKRSRQPYVDRSRAQVLRQRVLLSKGRRSFQDALQISGGLRLFPGGGSSSVAGVVSVGLPQPQIAPSAFSTGGHPFSHAATANRHQPQHRNTRRRHLWSSYQRAAPRDVQSKQSVHFPSTTRHRRRRAKHSFLP